MNRHVTRKNLWLLNTILVLVLSCVILCFAAGIAGTTPRERAPHGDDSVKAAAQLSDAARNFSRYEVICGNDLFRSKETREVDAAIVVDLPDPTKGLLFNGTSSDAKGCRAVLTDGLSKDPKTGSVTVFEVSTGDAMTRKYPKGPFSLRVLGVDTGYVRFIIEAWEGYDLTSHTEDELIFEMFTWERPGHRSPAKSE